MRKLPVYMLLDTSGSMHGEPIEQVKNGLQMLVSALRQDPFALETAFLSVITFDSRAKQVVPLTELTAFQVPNIEASGVTSLGDALRLVADCAAREVTKSTPERKGDWKPMVFIMTDGAPTDDWEPGLARFREEKWGMIVGCAIDEANSDVLKVVAGEAVITLQTSDPGSVAAFFKWVSASVSTNSAKIDSGGGEISGLDDLPPPPPEINVVV